MLKKVVLFNICEKKKENSPGFFDDEQSQKITVLFEVELFNITNYLTLKNIINNVWKTY